MLVQKATIYFGFPLTYFEKEANTGSKDGAP